MAEGENILHDEWGPEYILTVYDPISGMKGFLVVDNTARGVGKGGCRITPGLTLEEVYRLARTMTWKNALADIPFGGAKSGILIAENIDDNTKKAYVQSFARSIKPLIHTKYVAGPDVNSGEREMDWFVEALQDLKSATGKSSRNGGLPHELGSTGFGVAHAAIIAMSMRGLDVKRARVAVEGFGNVGSFVVKFLKEWGATIVAIADSRGTAYKDGGLDFDTALELRKELKSVRQYPGATAMDHDSIFGVDADVLIPATVTDVINDFNKDTIKARIVVEGANIPMSEGIERELHERGVLVVPDFVANAGGVISSYAEYEGYDKERMFEMVEEKVTRAAQIVLERSIKTDRLPRDVAVEIAKERVSSAMKKVMEK